VSDARDLDLGDASVDAVLLLGPLYHLRRRADRVRALSEARRVVRPGGPVFAAAISRWAPRIGGELRDRLYERFPHVRSAAGAVERTGVLPRCTPARSAASATGRSSCVASYAPPVSRWRNWSAWRGGVPARRSGRTAGRSGRAGRRAGYRPRRGAPAADVLRAASPARARRRGLFCSGCGTLHQRVCRVPQPCTKMLPGEGPLSLV
jgi:SAM-dependent methyltransferase